jgi:integrase
LLILTGQRRSEVANLSWSEIDLAGQTWMLPAGRAKNGHAHTIPLSEQALEVLAWLAPAFTSAETADVVFQPVGFSQAKARLDAALKPAVSAPFTLHDLRRTAASGMAGLGVQPHVIEACLNHRSGVIRGVVAIYNRHSYAAEKRAALDLWAVHVANIEPGAGPKVLALAA